MGLKEKSMEAAGDAAVGILDNLTKDIKAENKVSEFIEKGMPKLLATEKEYGMEKLVGFIAKLFVGQANRDPSGVAKRLLEFYNDLGAFFTDVSKPGIEEGEVVEEAEDDGDINQE